MKIFNVDPNGSGCTTGAGRQPGLAGTCNVIGTSAHRGERLCCECGIFRKHMIGDHGISCVFQRLQGIEHRWIGSERLEPFKVKVSRKQRRGVVVKKTETACCCIDGYLRYGDLSIGITDQLIFGYITDKGDWELGRRYNGLLSRCTLAVIVLNDDGVGIIFQTGGRECRGNGERRTTGWRCTS